MANKAKQELTAADVRAAVNTISTVLELAGALSPTDLDYLISRLQIVRADRTRKPEAKLPDLKVSGADWASVKAVNTVDATEAP